MERIDLWVISSIIDRRDGTHSDSELWPRGSAELPTPDWLLGDKASVNSTDARILPAETPVTSSESSHGFRLLSRLKFVSDSHRFLSKRFRLRRSHSHQQTAHITICKH
jgi:hypothetical protein